MDFFFQATHSFKQPVFSSDSFFQATRFFNYHPLTFSELGIEKIRKNHGKIKILYRSVIFYNFRKNHAPVKDFEFFRDFSTFLQGGHRENPQKSLQIFINFKSNSSNFSTFHKFLQHFSSHLFYFKRHFFFLAHVL